MRTQSCYGPAQNKVILTKYREYDICSCWSFRPVLWRNRFQTKGRLYITQRTQNILEAIRRKRPGQLTNVVILQHDNATPHTARVTQGWLEKYGWEILPHPPHCPDLAPSDYHLFGPLKRELAGKRFDDDEELLDHVRKWLQNLEGSFFREGMYSMVRRWQKCVDRLGCYVEK
ncbi:histone-lysine N-methyltransferase SETMAR [Elysia marginata]|uniref:Histone-lysine N-methyltransferase SETMAR n=1 Tax=Elysia marginata TaxID=1093978 RepID=A0AAV4JJF6_9GAST|nr:histone-lysine N-methyltransferase SETMAR [Elysia marginata]